LRKWLFRAGSKSRALLLAAIFFALIEATVFPLLAVSFSQVSEFIFDPNHKESEVALWCGIVMIIGVGNVIASYFRVYFTNMFGARLTETLRKKLFSFILRQPAAWFDLRTGNQSKLAR
jgi:ABC-type multidrug transport system fused ATPase/permease subunit